MLLLGAINEAITRLNTNLEVINQTLADIRPDPDVVSDSEIDPRSLERIRIIITVDTDGTATAECNLRLIVTGTSKRPK